MRVVRKASEVLYRLGIDQPRMSLDTSQLNRVIDVRARVQVLSTLGKQAIKTFTGVEGVIAIFFPVAT